MRAANGITAAVVFVNYGAYHHARARALSRIPGLDVRFIELAAEEGKYPWHISAGRTGPDLLTLAPTRYEHASKIALGRRLCQLLNTLRPDVVVTCGYREVPMLFGIAWAKLHARPLVLMFETSAADRPRPFWQELPKRAFLGLFVDAFFCGGLAHRRYLRQLGVADSRIWEKYDVVDVEYFRQAAERARADSTNLRTSLGLPEDYFLYVGRLSPEKNLPRLLHAYRRYRDLEPRGWKLVLVGQGPQGPALHDLAARLGLSDLVWAGAQPLDRLAVFYALARALVLPSLSEPWGLVVNEAMACGLPVLVSSHCGCAPDLVRVGTTGYVFNPLDVNDVMRQMLAFSRTDASAREQMGTAANDTISCYTPEVWADNLAMSIRTVVHLTRRESPARSG